MFYVVTRYNTSLFSEYEKVKDKWGVGDPDKWMARRLELFKTYTLPSMLNQSDMDFEWIFYFDKQTPKGHLEKWDALVRLMWTKEAIAPRINFMEKGQSITENFRFWVNRTGWSQGNIVITARIDNDDCWHRDRVRNIKRILEGLCNPPYLLEFENSLWYDPKNSKLLLHRDTRPCCGTMPVLCEKRGDALTVQDRGHGQIHEVLKDINNWMTLQGEPMQLIVCHDSNCSNNMEFAENSGGVEVPLTLLKDFGIGV